MLVGLFVHRIWVGFACGRACNLNNEDILLIQEIQLARLEYEPHSHSHTLTPTLARAHTLTHMRAITQSGSPGH